MAAPAGPWSGQQAAATGAAGGGAGAAATGSPKAVGSGFAPAASVAAAPPASMSPAGGLASSSTSAPTMPTRPSLVRPTLVRPLAGMARPLAMTAANAAAGPSTTGSASTSAAAGVPPYYVPALRPQVAAPYAAIPNMQVVRFKAADPSPDLQRHSATKTLVPTPSSGMAPSTSAQAHIVRPIASSPSDPPQRKLVRQLDFSVNAPVLTQSPSKDVVLRHQHQVLLQHQQLHAMQPQVQPLPPPPLQQKHIGHGPALVHVPGPAWPDRSVSPLTSPVRRTSPPRSGIKRSLDSTPKKKSCNCKNSRCLKLYCECFASGTYCSESCNCIGCYNNVESEQVRQEAVESTLERNPNAFRPKIACTPAAKDDAVELVAGRHSKGCHCKKSGCLKKYCECFQAGILCGENCKCVDCKNFEGSDERRAYFAAEVTGGAASVATTSPAPLSKKVRTSDAEKYTLQLHSAKRPLQVESPLRPARPVESANQQLQSRKSPLAGIIKQAAIEELCYLLLLVTQDKERLLKSAGAGAQQPVDTARHSTSVEPPADTMAVVVDKHKLRMHAVTAAAPALSSTVQSIAQNSNTPLPQPRENGGATTATPAARSERDSSSLSLLRRPPSPSTLSLLCDEKETLFPLPQSPKPLQPRPGELPRSPVTPLYQAQEHAVLVEFRDTLKKIVAVAQKRLQQQAAQG